MKGWEIELAKLQARVAVVLIGVEGMKADNQIRVAEGHVPLYGGRDFGAEVEKIEDLVREMARIEVDQ